LKETFLPLVTKLGTKVPKFLNPNPLRKRFEVLTLERINLGKNFKERNYPLNGTKAKEPREFGLNLYQIPNALGA